MGKGAPPLAASREGLETRARDVEPGRFPDLRLALDRLKLARPEQPGPAFLRGGPGHVRHPFEPHRALRPEHLEAEARARRRHRAQVARHPVLHPEQHRRRVVAVHRHDAPEALAIHLANRRRTGRSSRRWRARPSASARRTASRPSPRATRPASETARWETSSSLRRGGSSRARRCESARAASSSRDGSGGCSRGRA